MLAAFLTGTLSLNVAPRTPHAKLVFVRHGQSTWNNLNLFTGWKDVEVWIVPSQTVHMWIVPRKPCTLARYSTVPTLAARQLSDLGVEEAHAGGQEIKKADLKFDVAFTSLLKRAQNTLAIVLDESDQTDIPVVKDYRLNERHYGALQGKDKKETVQQYGEAQVKVWRRSYDVPPPPTEEGGDSDPRVDPLYAGIDPAMLPSCECLKDTVERCLPLWDESIAPALQEGQTVLVAAHGNSIRGLLKYLDGISDDEITGVEIPTGIPLVYDLDIDLKPIPAAGCVAPLCGAFLGDASAIAEAQAKVAAQTAVAQKVEEALPLKVEEGAEVDAKEEA